MSYITWRRRNEDRVAKEVSQGDLQNLSAWKDFSIVSGEIRDGLVWPVVRNMLKKEHMTSITFALTFMQYLYETYNISTLDVNLFTNMMVESESEFIDTIIDVERTSTASFILNKVRELLPGECKHQLDIVVDKMAQMGSEKENESNTKDSEST